MVKKLIKKLPNILSSFSYFSNNIVLLFSILNISSLQSLLKALTIISTINAGAKTRKEKDTEPRTVKAV